MGTKSLVNDFVYVNMLWTFGSLRFFICNYVLCSLGLILRYFFRFLKVGDAEKELHKPQSQADGNERSHEIDGFREELANFLFWSGDEDDILECSREREGDAESFVLKETVSDVLEDSEKLEGEKGCFVLQDINSEIHDGNEKTEVKADCSVSKENIHEDAAERRKEDASVFLESDSTNSFVHQEGEKSRVQTEGSVFIDTSSDVPLDCEKMDEDGTENSVFLENGSGSQHDGIIAEQEEENEEGTGEPFFIEKESNVHKDSKNLEVGEAESSVLMQRDFDVHEDSKMVEQDETECSVFMQSDSAVSKDSEKIDEEKEEEGHVFVETGTATTTSMCQYMSGKDVISGFIEEPTAMSFSFREYFMGPNVSPPVSNNSCASNAIIGTKVFSELDTEKGPVAQEGKDNLVRFEREAFGETDSSDEENFPFNENSVESDSESESSSSSGLIWGNSYKIEDSFAYQLLTKNEGLESAILKLMMQEEIIEVVDENKFSCGGKVSGEDRYIEMETGLKDLKSLNAHSFGHKDQKEGSYNEEKACRNEKSEEARWEEELCGSESDEENEDDLEWEHDELVEQLKMELKNARQGGLETIFEEEEEEVEEEEEEKVEEDEEEEDLKAESPAVVEDLKPLKIEEKLEYSDQIDEIEHVYKSYAEKMRKLDILNYQTMHALGLLQLKDPLKLISIPKSTIPGAKPVITPNLWPRKASKNTSDPLLKIVHELHRDLELVYVGQVCLSWEILCWQHKKAQELQQFHSQGCRYNHVAGEFQLFQVLMNRFIENEPFQQGTRTQNYVKNRCVIRNLLQVPAIKDDSMKDKNITKGDGEDAITSGRLADIIKESMSVFWEFVRADKDYGNVIPKVSQQIGTDLKDPAISGLLVDIRTQFQKKERKLKDIVRSGNCIVRKFQKHHEDPLDHEQMVAQVGLKLISRVLNMSKLRKEQVIWCHEKLLRVKFLTRKIVQVEPSFWLFPC
ncbi:hypothetical protein RIF29_15925 [Crotalaria pallida]|uniref:Ribosomal protein L34Ae n=1 Tax=Crotalaria pallida TaxID=3830 RepID=A0AAN9IJF9_CROPI